MMEHFQSGNNLQSFDSPNMNQERWNDSVIAFLLVNSLTFFQSNDFQN